MSDKPTKGYYHVQVRLKRTTTEEGYVLVPVTSEVIGLDRHLLPKEIFRVAVELAESGEVQWEAEDTKVEIHPIQRGRPVGRVAYSPVLGQAPREPAPSDGSNDDKP